MLPALDESDPVHLWDEKESHVISNLLSPPLHNRSLKINSDWQEENSEIPPCENCLMSVLPWIQFKHLSLTLTHTDSRR